MQICRITVTNSEEVMAERMEEFRQDPQRMSVATKFVNELLERAKDEAIKKRIDRAPTTEPRTADQSSVRKSSRWHLRIRSYFLRVFATVCLCNTSGGRDS